MRIAHFIDGLECTSGGPSVNVQKLCDGLSRHAKVDVLLYSQRDARKQPLPDSCTGNAVQWLESGSSVALNLGLPTRALVSKGEKLDQVDMVHVHGLWLPSNHWVCRAACKYGVKLALSPRGLLQPWALRHKRLRKLFAMNAYQRADLQRVDVFFAASNAELDGIRRLGLRQPVALIPNGVELPEAVPRRDANGDEQDNGRTVLFLSRLHPSKGLEPLLRVWARLAPLGWQLRIVGEGEPAYEARLRAMINSLRIESSVELVGARYGQDKILEYQGADLFVLPTRSENFGVVVLEALACALPVLTTKAAPWAELLKEGCGWWLDEGETSFELGLRKAMAEPPENLREMGRRGRVLAARYNWPDIARRTADVYAWMLGQRECPPDVVLE